MWVSAWLRFTARYCYEILDLFRIDWSRGHKRYSRHLIQTMQSRRLVSRLFVARAFLHKMSDTFFLDSKESSLLGLYGWGNVYCLLLERDFRTTHSVSQYDSLSTPWLVIACATFPDPERRCLGTVAFGCGNTRLKTYQDWIGLWATGAAKCEQKSWLPCNAVGFDSCICRRPT